MASGGMLSCPTVCVKNYLISLNQPVVVIAMVRIRLIGSMAHLAKAHEVYLNLEEPKTVDELLKKIIRDYDKLHDKIVIVNGRPVKGDYLIKEGDEIKVMPVLSGG